MTCQPGGVGQLVLNSILNLVCATGADQLGRWTWHEIRLDGTRKLYVITAYRVGNKPTKKSAMTTAWHQQYRKLLLRGLTDPEPRQQFMTDLRKFLLNIKSQGSVYSLNWDANTAHNDDEILDLLQDTDMTDVFDDYFFHRPPTHQ